ncbi:MULTISPECIES: FHA domain-containing protein [unclassified Leifsonia]|uniref:FHA domain-containing protein n=1 Tax=unclassified Leifsonia TaxID=2663824 RepID=UPI0008A754A1|nr:MULTISPECIES: FHA domain-containing protein [unclassified Leifsonia]SEH56168.1 FHA domain-containing protein [Leifsonia sp. CL154]SFL22864.1 FHA domain-containing protein [Leifsonia sp. CL147]
MVEVRQSTAGGWVVVAVQDRVLLAEVGESATAETVTVLLDTLRGADAFERTIERLTAQGLVATPAFALVDRDAGSTVRCVLRGPVLLRVTTAEWLREVRAEQVSTWLETTIAGVTSFRVSVVGAVAEGVGALPLVEGAVWAVEAGTVEASLEDATVVVAPRVRSQTPAVPAVPAVPVLAAEAPAQLAEATIADPAVLDTPDVTLLRGAESHDDAEPAESAEPGDHDGLTIMSSELGGRRSVAPPAADPRPPMKASPRYFVELADGRREDLAVPIVVGRAPSADSASRSAHPRLVVVPSAEQDISRSHVLVAVEGDTVVVTDLHSRNGTVVVNPGAQPQKLRRGEPTALIVGSAIDLGDGVVMTVGAES